MSGRKSDLKSDLRFDAHTKAALLRRLREDVGRIERHMPRMEDAHATWRVRGQKGGWWLGADAADALLPGGLATDALHEIKARARGAGAAAAPASAGDWLAAFAFATRLAVRRIEALDGHAAPVIAWCWPRAFANEFGRPSAAGFARLGLDPHRLIIVETAREAATLDALEECLKGSGLALAIGAVREVPPTPARRLSLAAGEAGTACLIVTHPSRPAALATATRWRITRQTSARQSFDAAAPGSARFSLTLERCRARPESTAKPPILVEWSDETHRFAMASVMAGHASHARRAGSGAAEPAVRTG